jgi:hypothetical protein
MAGKNTDRIQKEWVVRQLQHAAKLKTLAAVKKYQEQLSERLEGETNTTDRCVRPTKPIYCKSTFTHKFSSSLLQEISLSIKS